MSRDPSARDRAPRTVSDEDAEHYRFAVDAAPVGIICVSGAKGKYVFANEAFAQMIGRPLEEVLRSDPFQIATDATHPEDRSLGQEAMARIARGEMDRYTYEKRLQRPTGEVVWASVELVATRDAQGRLAFLTFYFTDIGDRRKVEKDREALKAELREAHKLEALGRLAGGVAHDFNNRLVIILGYADLLKQALAGTERADYAEMVLQSADRATELTRQLLAYSRRQVLNPVSFDLNVTVENMRALLSRLIGEDVELDTRLDASWNVYADPGCVEQVIMNLAINARDAMPKGGRLSLETNDTTLESRREALPSGDYVTLVVRDTGQGIPDTVLSRIFEPFFSTKEVGRGTGLGLSTVQGIVRQSRGSVYVESTVGQGTKFTIHLPRATEKPVVSQERPRGAPLPSSNFETVLVCDDDDGVRRLMSDVLKLRAYTVLQAKDGRDALEVAKNSARSIDLLITDLVMPVLGGEELARELRKTHPLVRVLYVSGYTDDPKLLAGVVGPGAAFLPKPFLPGALTEAVCSLLERSE